MKPEHLEILNARRMPGKLLVEQVAALLGFQEHDIPVLVAGGLLAPLGNPTAQSCTKYFHAPDIAAKAADRKWMHRATSHIYRHWQGANARRHKNQPTAP